MVTPLTGAEAPGYPQSSPPGEQASSHSSRRGGDLWGVKLRSTVFLIRRKQEMEVARLYLGTEGGWDVRGVTQMERITPVQFI